MTPESINKSIPETQSVASQSFFSRLGGVYLSPGNTFREIGRSQRVLAPIIAMILVGLLAGFFMTKKLDLESMLVRQMETAVAQGRITQEQMEQQTQRMSTIGKGIGVLLILSTAFGGLALSLIIAGGFKLISVLIGAENQFKAVFSVTIYTMLAVSIVSYALFVLVASFKDLSELTFADLNTVVSSNLGAILAGILGQDALPKFVAKLAGYIDVFAIWQIALLSIGYSAVSRKLKTSTAVVWIASVYSIIAVIGSLVASRTS